MREHSLIFQPESVRGMTADPPTKWQSRRVISAQNSLIDGTGKGIRKCWPQMKLDSGIPYAGGWEVACGRCGSIHSVTPRIQPGDLVRVKETWAPPYGGLPTYYKADCEIDGVPCEPKHVPSRPDSKKWQSPLYMPRDASRAWLLISDVQGQMIQDITEAEAIAEGTRDYPDADDPPEEHDWSLCPKCGGTLLYDDCGPCFGVIFDNDCYECDTHVKRFKHRWNHINGHRPGCDWASNPPVWRYTVGCVLNRAEADEYLGRES